MQRAGIYVLRQASLFNAPQPLEIRMLDDVENEIAGNGNESVYRIIENFLFIRLIGERQGKTTNLGLRLKSVEQ